MVFDRAVSCAGLHSSSFGCMIGRYDRIAIRLPAPKSERDMSDAMTSSLGIVAYLALFASIGILFLLVNLLVGKLIRPTDPHEEKLEIYECGEPAVGSSFVQFDLRFYVVALLFIIFDVEVAFFFPWATVFGKATHLSRLAKENQVVEEQDATLRLTPAARALYEEMGIEPANVTVPTDVPPSLFTQSRGSSSGVPRSTAIVLHGAHQLAVITIVDIAVFFAVLMVGFAYVWMRGDLNWVRAYKRGESAPRGPTGREDVDLEQALSA
jgi:NADH-quinone oxidoreductase subunit A